MIATKSGVRAQRKTIAPIPNELIYEIIDGQPIHYKGYREVLSGQKTFSEIMGSSTLQAQIVSYLMFLLARTIDEEKFNVLTSEAGIHLNNRNNLAGDILIFDNDTLSVADADLHYAQVPPKIVIEVDIAADPYDMETNTYIFKKTQNLLDFGVEKVIWITTEAKKVTIATHNEDWQTKDWNKDVEIMDGIVFNVSAYLARKGSPFA